MPITVSEVPGWKKKINKLLKKRPKDRLTQRDLAGAKQKATGGPRGLGGVGSVLGGVGSALAPTGISMLGSKKSAQDLKEDVSKWKKWKENRKKNKKPATPLGGNIKPGSWASQQQYLLKPGYKVAPMATGGDTFGKMLDKKFIKYAGSKEAQLHAKDFDEGLDRAERRAALETKQAYKKNKKTAKKLSHGGEARTRGMGAAIRGGKFEGVF